MNGRKKGRLFKRRKKQAEEAMQELISLNEMINLFGNKSKVADEIDPSIKKGLYNPLQQLDKRTGEPLDSLFQDEERWKLTPDVIDPITGQPGDLYGAPTQSSDWWKKEKGYVKDPDTGEWYEPDFPLGSAGGQPTYNPEFHQGMEKELARVESLHQRRMDKLKETQRRQVNALLREKRRNKKDLKFDIPLEDDSLRMGNWRGNILGFGAPSGFTPSKEVIKRLLSPGERLMPQKIREKYRALWKDERAVLPSQRERPGVQYV